MRIDLTQLLLLVSMICCMERPGMAEPTAENPTGWRGDGSGKYPNTAPALTWERRIMTRLSALTFQARRPAASQGAAGEPLRRARAAFEPKEWLVLGPINVTQPDKALEQPTTLNESTTSPDDGEALGSVTWKRAKVAERGVDFIPLFGRTDHENIAYLFTYIYAPQEIDAGVRAHGDHGNWRFWLNGKAENGWELASHHFNQGWNKLLVKVVCWSKSNTSNFHLSLGVLPGPEVQYESKNIAWTTRMPGPGFGMPIVVGDKLLLTSEPNDVVCVDKRTGQVLWMHSDALWYAATKIEPPGGPLDEFRPQVAKLEVMEEQFVRSVGNIPRDKKGFEQWQNANDARRKLAQDLTDSVKKMDHKYGVLLGWGGGNCGPTPCSDGKYVFTWHGETGVLSCFDLDGNRIYARFSHSGPGDEHGVNASPLLIGDRILVIGGKQWLCFKKETGDLLWTQKYRHPCYGTAVAANVGGESVAIGPDGQIVRVRDGTVLQKAYGPYDGEVASVIRDDDRFYLIARGGFCEATLPASFANDAVAPVTCQLAPAELQDSETYPVGSPLFFDGLFYATHSGWASRGYPVLLVIDPKEKKVVYRQKLDMTPEIHYAPDGAGVAASIAMAGGKLFVMDNRGTTLIFEPGREFRMVSKNIIEHITHGARQEITESTPIFDGNRMYYRAEENLYCVEPK